MEKSLNGTARRRLGVADSPEFYFCINSLKTSDCFRRNKGGGIYVVLSPCPCSA